MPIQPLWGAVSSPNFSKHHGLDFFIVLSGHPAFNPGRVDCVAPLSPLFQFAIFSFLHGCLVEVAIFKLGECGACETRECLWQKYRWWLLTLGIVHSDCGDGGVHLAGYVPLCLFWLSLLVVAWLWFGMAMNFLLKMPLSTPMGSGHYLKFLWQSRTARWYLAACRLLEIMACGGVFALLAAAFAFLGTRALIWALQEKLIEGLFVIISMRQFSRPVSPCFNFGIEDFEHIRFKLGIIFNSNAIVHDLHGDFCRAFADGVRMVDQMEDAGTIRSMLKTAPVKELCKE